MAEERAPPDAKVAAIAARQHGVVSIGQLREAGLSEDAVGGRVRAGWLHRLHRGVYAVGHPGLTFHRRGMAAVLALGDAYLSHRSAAALWQLLPVEPGPIDAAVPSRNGRRRHRGIRVHRPVSLPPEALTRRHGIPVTTPARTVADLRRVVVPSIWRRAVRRAEVLGLPLGPTVEGDATRSELERLFLRLCRRNGLPMPEVNVRVGRRVADFLWREQRLIVETDGYRFHRGREAFEDDRGRDLELRALGFEVIRLSYRQVTGEAQRIAAVLREALRDL
jgi:very-short-patch-repair endonuclease